VEHRSLYTSIDPLQSMSREEKLDILRRVDKTARAADKRVQEVSASLTGVYELILVAATDGTLAADVRPLVRLPSACWWKRMANASAAPAAAAVVLATTISWTRRMATFAPMFGRKKPCAWRWST
jgi:predicted Zn-dependent protease